MLGDDENDELDSGAQEEEDAEVLEEVGEDRRDPTTGSVESGEDLLTVPEEITGRANSTSEDLTTLFRGEERGHMTDGFRGGSDDDPADTLPGEDGEVADID